VGVAAIALLLLGNHSTLRAGDQRYPGIQLNTGKQIYEAACAACHGPKGQGMPQTTTGFKRPDTFPDFTRCDQTTSELNTDYKAVVVHGGPFRGFSQIMPAFGEALTDRQIDAAIEYLRGFCTNSHWPRGELNLPRALITEKAYPEDEVVLTESLNAQGAPQATTQAVYEQRFGMKNEIEITVPFTFQDQNHTYYGGFQDSTIGVKRAFYSNMRTGSIFALQGEVSLPVGNVDRGFGRGVTTFTPFAAYGQLLPANFFLEFQGGADLPVNTRISPQDIFYNTVVGANIAHNKGLGRLWSPMVEFLATRNLQTGATTSWDVVPQVEVTINKRQHIRGDIGVRIPTANTAGRQVQLMFYLLWDWQEGKLTQGW
jgi:mono/diheme cytochrome c family protein